MKTNTNETPGDYLRRTLKDNDAMLEVARLATEDQRKAMTQNTKEHKSGCPMVSIGWSATIPPYCTCNERSSDSSGGQVFTHNTREVKDKYPNYKELDMDKYQRIVEAGNFDEMFNYGFDVGKTELYHQLQKAQQELSEERTGFLNHIAKLEKTHQKELQKARVEVLKEIETIAVKTDCDYASAINRYMRSNSISEESITPNHSELDQDNK